jgi:hypothetical protein
LALDVAGFAEAFAERGSMTRRAIDRPAADKPDHRHRRLLCARAERPRNRSGADRLDKLAPSHAELHRKR